MIGENWGLGVSRGQEAEPKVTCPGAPTGPGSPLGPTGPGEPGNPWERAL